MFNVRSFLRNVNLCTYWYGSNLVQKEENNWHGVLCSSCYLVLENI